MKITPISNRYNTIKKQTKTNISNIGEKIPKKVTIDNLPIITGLVGLMTPIPFASVILFGIGKIIQVTVKKFLHKP